MCLKFLIGFIVLVFTSCSFNSSDDSSGIDVLPQIHDSSRWSYFQTYDQRSLDDITTFTASGLVSEQFSELFTDDTYIYVASNVAGISYIKISDVENPQGKVFNYTGRDGDDISLRFGASGFAKRDSDNKVFAWYGHDIVDILNTAIVYSNAPDSTHSYYGCSPKDRFVIDNSGNFWIGTSNQEDDGSLRTNDTDDANGLFKISAGFSTRTKLLDDAVWNVFKDSSGDIWISTNTGIWRSTNGADPVKVYSAGLYADQIFEFGGKIYAVVKDFFHNPYFNSPSKDYDLYEWDGSQFILNCSITTGDDSLYAFIYENNLYIRGNSFFLYDSTTPEFINVSNFGTPMGYYALTESNGMLISVGNITGVAIYNYLNNNSTIQLTTANTAEALIVDSIHSLYSDSNNLMYIGPDSSGFNTFKNDLMNIYELEDEICSVGFFEHNADIYIQGAGNLYTFSNNEVTPFLYFPTNGEKIYYDSSGYVWSFPNWGSGYGGIAKLDLATKQISGTKDSGGNDYWNTSTSWILDRGYHFNDIIRIPDSDTVMIGVSGDYFQEQMPYTLKYDHSEDIFSKVSIPDSSSEGILAMESDGNIIYGVARQKLYRYENGEWQFYCNLILGNDIRDIKIVNNFAFIISGWNSSGDGERGGVEVVDLYLMESTHYTSADIPLPSEEVFAIEIQDFGNNSYRLWLGTFDGLGYCDLSL